MSGSKTQRWSKGPSYAQDMWLHIILLPFQDVSEVLEVMGGCVLVASER